MTSKSSPISSCSMKIKQSVSLPRKLKLDFWNSNRVKELSMKSTCLKDMVFQKSKTSYTTRKQKPSMSWAIEDMECLECTYAEF